MRCLNQSGENLCLSKEWQIIVWESGGGNHSYWILFLRLLYTQHKDKLRNVGLFTSVWAAASKQTQQARWANHNCRRQLTINGRQFRRSSGAVRWAVSPTRPPRSFSVAKWLGWVQLSVGTSAPAPLLGFFTAFVMHYHLTCYKTAPQKATPLGSQRQQLQRNC